MGILDGVRKVAVKIVNSPTQRHQKRFVQEIATLRACYDSNIVSFLGASVQEGAWLLIVPSKHSLKPEVWPSVVFNLLWTYIIQSDAFYSVKNSVAFCRTSCISQM